MSTERNFISPEKIKVLLKRILDSSEFDASQRNRQFLQYVVEETLAGREKQIKAYNIATTVFGREGTFDPQTDPIVRIEACRLRRSLERYYLIKGQSVPFRITIPKGSYVPVFETSEVTPSVNENTPIPEIAAASVSTRSQVGPVIFVTPFEEDGDRSTFPDISRGFTRQVIVALTRFKSLFVYGPETTSLYGAGCKPGEFQPDLDADFILSGGVTVLADVFSVAVILTNARTGHNLWGENIEASLQPKCIIEVRDRLANRIAQTLAHPYGIILREKAKEFEGQAPTTLTSFNCVSRFYDYWRAFDGDLHETIRACLERTIVNDPNYAEAFACLSQVYSNAYRFNRLSGVITIEPLKRALLLAQRAIELAPDSSRGYHALGLALWFMRDGDGSVEALETGLQINPNDSEIMADLGLRAALLAEWYKAMPLVQEAFARNPARPLLYHFVQSLYHYVHGDYERALLDAKKVQVPSVVYGSILMAMAAAQIGRMQDAKAAVNEILAIDPEYGAHIRFDLKKRNVHPDLIETIVAGLRRAGLSGPEMDSPESAGRACSRA